MQERSCAREDAFTIVHRHIRMGLSLRRLWINDWTKPEERYEICTRFAAFQSIITAILVPLLVKIIPGTRIAA